MSADELGEEEALYTSHVTGRVRQSFDMDRVTKRFYDRFKGEHTAFLQFIEGITSSTDRQWYASLMLNRLMFIYFIQKKGFLDDDEDYLSNRLRALQATERKTAFFSFYRAFLCRLFRYDPGS